MATDKRTFPNDYFAWYNDDDRLAVVCKVLSNDVSDSTETTTDTYDTYTGSSITDGIKITIHSKYETATALTDDLQSTCGLNETMHSYVLDYVKSRILEDQGDLEKSAFFKNKYEGGVMKAPTRKSGVRVLLVPEL